MPDSRRLPIIRARRPHIRIRRDVTRHQVNRSTEVLEDRWSKSVPPIHWLGKNAQCGLYKQFHRAEGDVYSNIAYLHKTRYGAAPALRSAPNKYLRG
jgi:hypothetical protein